jgi:hypothetical protein
MMGMLFKPVHEKATGWALTRRAVFSELPG